MCAWVGHFKWLFQQLIRIYYSPRVYYNYTVKFSIHTKEIIHVRINDLRFLVKCQQEDKAEEILCKIYGSKSKASSQLAEIRSVVDSSSKTLKQTLIYVLQWKILQRYAKCMCAHACSTYVAISIIHA